MLVTNQQRTLCISTFETKDPDTWSRLPFNTSTTKAVTTSAYFEGNPLASSHRA